MHRHADRRGFLPLAPRSTSPAASASSTSPTTAARCLTSTAASAARAARIGCACRRKARPRPPDVPPAAVRLLPRLHASMSPPMPRASPAAAAAVHGARRSTRTRSPISTAPVSSRPRRGQLPLPARYGALRSIASPISRSTDFDLALKLKPDDPMALVARASLGVMPPRMPPEMLATELRRRGSARCRRTPTRASGWVSCTLTPDSFRRRCCSTSKWIDSHAQREDADGSVCLNSRCWARALWGHEIGRGVSGLQQPPLKLRPGSACLSGQSRPGVPAQGRLQERHCGLRLRRCG